VGSFRVVVFSPFFDQDLCLPQAVEDFAVQEFIAKPGIEAFAVAVLPGRPWLNVSGLGPDGADLLLNCVSDKFGAVTPSE
jgi:hypothetical protein